jgi:4-aminobutyrate--pyruvate transaminase
MPAYTNLSERRAGDVSVIDRAEGVFVYTADGRVLLDAMSSMWAATLGFSNKRVVQAAKTQLERMPFYHCGLRMTHNPAVELAERLANMVPIRGARIHYATTGSEANDFLVKFIWYYNNAVGRPRKKKIISRVNSWHGATIASGSMSGIARGRIGFDLPIDRFIYTDEPHYYREALAGETERQFCERLASNLDELIEREGPDTVAAFIAEPVTGSSGVVVPPRPYYPMIQEVLRRHGVLFIADEVITGFGRTGHMFGSTAFDIEPDAMTFAKGLTAAYAPLSAIAISEELYEGIVKGSDSLGFFSHGTTFAGHPVGCATALEVLRVLEDDGILGNVNRCGARLGEGLKRMLKLPYVGEVRGIGLMWGVELVADKVSRRLFAKTGEAGRALAAAAERNGLIVRNVAKGDAVAIAPPLIISEAEVDELLIRFERALTETLHTIEERGLHH